MKPELAFDLAVIVKNVKAYEALKDYAKDRIEFHHNETELYSKPEDWYRSQGAIKELKRVLKLADEVEQRVKEFKEIDNKKV